MVGKHETEKTCFPHGGQRWGEGGAGGRGGEAGERGEREGEQKREVKGWEEKGGERWTEGGEGGRERGERPWSQ